MLLRTSYLLPLGVFLFTACSGSPPTDGPTTSTSSQADTNDDTDSTTATGDGDATTSDTNDPTGDGDGDQSTTDDDPDETAGYPCYGEALTYLVDDAGELESAPYSKELVYFDDRGNVIKQIFDQDADGTPDWIDSYMFNDQGLKILYAYDTDGDGTNEKSSTYVYDTEGRLISSEEMGSDGVTDYTWHLSYDDQGRAIRALALFPDETTYRDVTYTWTSDLAYTYASIQTTSPYVELYGQIIVDDEGRTVLEEAWYGNDPESVIKTETYTYDDEGRLTSSTSDASELEVSTYAYDDRGLTTEVQRTVAEQPASTKKYTYFDTCP